MARAITTTSSLLYLYRIGALDLLPRLFDEVWITAEVLEELLEARFIGTDVPNPLEFDWIVYRDPEHIPTEWSTWDLSASDLATMALAYENPDSVVLLDEMHARSAIRPLDLRVWGTLTVLFEAKLRGHIRRIELFIDRLGEAGIMLTAEHRLRILRLARETNQTTAELPGMEDK